MSYLDSYKHVLTFLSNFNNWEEADYLYERVNSFFTEHYLASPLIVFSLAKDTSGIEKKARVIWNKDAFGDFDREDILNFIERTGTQRLIKEHRVTETFNSFDYHLFFVGEEETQIYIACFRLEPQKIENEILNALISYIHNSYGQIQRWRTLNKQSSLVHVDDVSGLYNQRKLYKDLSSLIKRYERSGENFALLFIDIDHFKNVNDNYGHIVGTKLLLDLGKVLRRVLRDTDLLYRYGGDEFVVIIPDANTNDARLIGERVLKTVRQEHFKVESYDEVFRISISVGIANFPRDAKDGKEVLELADKMMYRAKNKGRGCVCLAADFYKT